MTDMIGLVGLGLVGTAIAERLLAAGFDVVGFDIDPTRCKHFRQLGGNAAGSPAEIAQAAKRVVLSLPDTDIVRQVIEGPAGILQAKTLPKYIIDTTTGDPEKTMALAQRLAEYEIHLLDATTGVSLARLDHVPFAITL